MNLLRFALTGDTGKKPEEAKSVENKPEQNSEKDKMEFGSSNSVEEFERIVGGGKDAYGHYKDFHGEYRERMDKKLREIIEGRKKEGRSFDKEYIHNLAKKLNNEPDQASKLLAKAMGYK
jgi:hypothetical protein